jgi:MoxR-like ATPase
MTNSVTSSDENIRRAIQIVERLKTEIGKVVVGQHAVIEQVLAALLAAGHVLIEGVPGLGKTLLVHALARTFAGKSARIQFTPDLMPSDVTGHTLYDQGTQKFVARRGPVFTNLLLADEINRAPAKTQAALLEVMQESQVTIEGEAHALSPPFMVLATQNPIEQEGTYPLPEAQLDRFLLKIRIAYPTHAEETELVRHVTHGQVGDRLDVSSVATLIDPASVVKLQRIVASLTVEERVLDYAVRITRTTRTFNGVAAGAGPRGAISLIRAGRAAALLAGRDYVTPDDVKHIAHAALRHRISPAPELQIEGHDADMIISQLLEQVEAPRA